MCLIVHKIMYIVVCVAICKGARVNYCTLMVVVHNQSTKTFSYIANLLCKASNCNPPMFFLPKYFGR